MSGQSSVADMAQPGARYDLRPRTKPSSSGGGTPQDPDTSGDLESTFSTDDEEWEEVHAGEATSVGSNNVKTKEMETPGNVEQSCDQPKEKEVERLKSDLLKANEQLKEKDDEIYRLCRQASQSQGTESGEFLSAKSTPYSSMTTETATHEPNTHTRQQGGRVTDEAVFSHSEEPPYVGHLRQQLEEPEEQWKKAEKRARYFEREFHKMMEENAAFKVEPKGDGIQAKDQAIQELVGKLKKAEAKMKKIQEHSTSQSQTIHMLQNDAKARDAEASELQRKIQDLVGQLEVLKAKKEKEDLKHQETMNVLQSFRQQVRKLTDENASLSEKLQKFGYLQSEGLELSAKVAQLQEALKKVSEERDELKFLLEATQAQAKVYEEDFQKEREDRARAFAEKENNKEEIESLQIQLDSHKKKLADLEIIHQARQKELMKVHEDLSKCQEEVQAKTSQVKQYKKQHDGLVAKVTELEQDKEGLTGQFEAMRQKVEQKSKKKPQAEGEQSDLEKHYKEKSKSRKAELAKMTKAYSEAKQEVMKMKKEAKKEKKKTASQVNISTPVNKSKLHELCRSLQADNEDLKDQVKALMETNEHLNSCVSALTDNDTISVGSPTEQEPPLSPDDDDLSDSSATISKVSTKLTSSRTRAKTFSGTSPSAQPKGKPGQSTPRYTNIPGANTASAVKTDIQHADYVNQSRIQEMIAQSQQSGCLPSSPPDASSLPAPIMVFTEDSTSNRGNQPSPVQGGMPASGVGGGVGGRLGVGGVGGVVGTERERRGSAPAWVAKDPNHLQALHEKQHQLQYNQSGPTSLPTYPTNPQPPNYPIDAQPQPQPRKDQPASQPKPTSAGPTPAEREMMMKQEEKRQGGDILSPGIATEVHGMAQDVIEEMEDGGGHEVTGTPYDPNLTCIICQKMFRIGEIQLYRTHTENCNGTMV